MRGSLWYIYKAFRLGLESIPLRLLSNYISLPPRVLTFAITYRCNLRCIMCNIWKTYIEKPGAVHTELKTEDVRYLFEESNMLKGLESIGITGGEPFLRPDLSDIIEIIHQNVPRSGISIATNGTLTDVIYSRVNEMLEITPSLSVVVSIDGIGDVHDETRGVEGAFEKAVETLNRLVELRKEKRGLTLGMGMTIMPSNYTEIANVYGLSRNLGVDFGCVPAQMSDIYYRNVEKKDLFQYELNKLEEQFEVLKKEVRRDAGLIPSLSHLFFFEGCTTYIKDPYTQILPCFAGTFSLFLDPYGNVFPCIHMNARVGNIRDEAFDVLWRSETAKKTRRMVRKGKCPNCWSNCDSTWSMQIQFFRLFSWSVKHIIKEIV